MVLFLSQIAVINENAFVRHPQQRVSAASGKERRFDIDVKIFIPQFTVFQITFSELIFDHIRTRLERQLLLRRADGGVQNKLIDPFARFFAVVLRA